MFAIWISILMILPTEVHNLILLHNTPTPTAFTKGQTAYLHLTRGEKIPFNKRITEIGAQFDSDGSFICQTLGLYAFTFYGLSALDWRIWVEMMKNDELIASMYAYTHNGYADAGNAAILHLNVGDKVYLKAHSGYNQTLFGKAAQIYATFTGEFLYPDNHGRPNIVSSYGAVGFSAIMTKHASISDGSNILYDKAITNIGNGYDVTTGTFTAPVEGTYVFHFHTLASLNSIAWIELFHSNQYVVSAYGYTTGSYASSGNTAVLRLHTGDTVKVKARSGTDVKLFGTSGQYYTTFCGALLSPSLHEGGSGTQQEIAFSVGLSHQESAANSPTVVFDKVFLNLGQNFNINTGTFTATVPGIYTFHYHATAQKGKDVWVELYHNYIYVNSLYGDTTGNYGPGSNSAVLELVSGDTVYLDIQHHGSFLFGERDRVYGTFSGYLLSPIAFSYPVVG